MKRLLVRLWHYLRGSHDCGCGHRFNPDHFVAGAFVEAPEGSVFCRLCPCRIKPSDPISRACACPRGRR